MRLHSHHMCTIYLDDVVFAYHFPDPNNTVVIYNQHDNAFTILRHLEQAERLLDNYREACDKWAKQPDLRLVYSFAKNQKVKWTVEYADRLVFAAALHRIRDLLDPKHMQHDDDVPF